MMDVRLLSSSRKSTFIKIGSWLLIIPSAIIGILLVELFCWLFSVDRLRQGVYQWNQRIIFFEGRDTIFENHQDIFTYIPHDEIRNLTGFFSDDEFIVEYDYHFRTNNFGLVQDADIVPERESLLLLGDSFTEGQGAEPWFRLVSPEIDKLGYQAINGGLLATGFEQWLRLDRYLADQHVRIRKLVVIFISHDYHRLVTHFPSVVLQCLSALSACRVEDSYFYRMPPREELASWVAKIRTARGPWMIWLKARAAALLPASFHVYKHFKESVGFGGVDFTRAEQESRAAIAELIRLYGPENVAFIHLPQKEEVGYGPNNLGLRARRAIEAAGGKLFDGFKLCQLTGTDYYVNDDHPNKDGYTKIAACAANVIKELVAGGQ